ncbi:MAG: HNH endonuclease, partial [Chitinophagaceae bacterium]|nr:HNH endonuclease [Chitinophagaceae bacterium]
MSIEKRKKIPDAIAASVMFKSDLKCCICSNKGDHIHHLDGNRNNNSIENLALLCFSHHDSASIKNSLSRKLSKDVIIKYRTLHYSVIEIER